VLDCFTFCCVPNYKFLL